jgi:hypothetical protein
MADREIVVGNKLCISQKTSYQQIAFQPRIESLSIRQDS